MSPLPLLPDTRAGKLRLGIMVLVLAALALFVARRLVLHFGWGQGNLRPQIAEGPAPPHTPLPHAEPMPAARLRSVWQTLPVSAGGQPPAARRALWLLPEPSPASAPSSSKPLVIVMHGDGGDPDMFHSDFTYEEVSGDWAVLVYPEGRRRHWDTESSHDNADVAFLDSLIDIAIKTYAVDPKQVFLTGYSSGGFMAQLYACQRSNVVRAIATHEAGAPYNQPERWPNGSPKCPGQGPVATLVSHGRDDLSVSFRSGEYSAHYWAAVNGCDVRRAEPTAYPQCYAYAGCAEGKPTVFCDIPNWGHWIWSGGALTSLRFFQELGP